MRIGFDATSLCRKTTGIESYSLNLLKSLLLYDKENEYTVFFRKEVHPELKPFSKRARFVVQRSGGQVFCEQVWLPCAAWIENVDLMHFPAFPPGPLTFKKYVFTVHDGTLWKHPETLSWKGKWYFKPFSTLGAKRAEKVITVSESSINDIEKLLKIRRENIVNASEAISGGFIRAEDEGRKKAIMKEYGLPGKIILSVNSAEPRKNIVTLIRAYKDLAEGSPSIEHKLVLAGRKAWGQEAVSREVMKLGLEGRVIMTGHIPMEHLVALYNMADVFVYPSIYEGFGLPPLEAMACGVPVIASDIQVLRETLGDAAVFAPALDHQKMAAAIRKMIFDSEAKKIFVEKGFKRCGYFSWKATAEKVIGTYKLTEKKRMPSGTLKKVNICGIDVDNMTMDETLGVICGAVENKSNIYVVTPNTDHIVRLSKDEDFRKVYRNAALVIPDGIPLVWGSKFLGTPLKGRVTGSDLAPKLCEISSKKGYTLFFLGGRPGAAEGAKAKLQKKFPELKIAGTYSPPFGFEKDNNELKKIEDMIISAAPDILFVGLGAPKQEKWIFDSHKKLGVPVSIGVGVTFEFMSGMVKRAPVWVQRAGFEWFWRLMMEPRRLWKRYLVEDVSFFWLVLKQKVGRK